jgi:glycosyltransferase involved in cell wall biosynthesis
VKIQGVTRMWEGGGYYRIRQPLDELAKHGHETSCYMAKSDVKPDGSDVIVGQLIGAQAVSVDSPTGAKVYATVVVHAWWRDLYRHAPLVYELDDDPFEIDPDNPSYGIYSNPIAHDSIQHCLQIANLVTVSTEPLAERMRKYNKNVVVIGNHIDESMLAMERPKRDRLTIGWAGGTSHIKDIMSASYGLKRIMDWHKDVDVHFIGADLRFAIKTPRPIRFTGWTSNTTEYYQNIDFDIGIAPLVPTRFAEAKSHIKPLEYGALGIPCVATDVYPYSNFIIDGVTGFLVRKDHEWTQRLRDLINDEAMRLEMGEAAKKLASTWTIQEGYQKWESAYASLL